MRFKLDENIDVRAAAVLEQAGHDVATVVGQRLAGAVDAVVAEAVRVEEDSRFRPDGGVPGPATGSEHVEAGVEGGDADVPRRTRPQPSWAWNRW